MIPVAIKILSVADKIIFLSQIFNFKIVENIFQ